MRIIYADQRWIGDHGIGRFARRVLSALRYHPIPLTGHPAAAFDSYRLARAVSGLRRDDLFFSPGYNSPLTCPSPFVFTIHDLSHVFCPENSSPLIRLYYASVMKSACRRAADILTVSEFTRSQILQWSGVSPEKIHNVSCGVDSPYCPAGDAYGFPFPYLLSVSNRKPHKNEFRIVEGFAKSGVAADVHLVFTGNPSSDMAKCIHRGGVTGFVHFTGYISEEKLPSLYRGAQALIFPSLYEGFGLPILEAMACGTPVVTSNVTGMPEVAKDASILVDPSSAEQIAHAIDEVVNNASLGAQLRSKGLLRAKEFTWDKTIRRVKQVIDKGEKSAPDTSQLSPLPEFFQAEQ
jgi:glycosyltransferase involved in cell wall biosynthesis